MVWIGLLSESRLSGGSANDMPAAVANVFQEIVMVVVLSEAV
jgi:hypothetical protein